MDASSLDPVVVLGATASGKSDLAFWLARAFGGEIVSFDATCVYRGLDVGTAKPTARMRAEVPHHLLDVADPAERFSAGRFVTAATQALAEIRGRGRLAVLVGGTGLYLRALLRGLVPSPPPSDGLRRRLREREARRPGALLALARRLDPDAAARLHERDELRLVRVVEHRLATGHRLSAARRGCWSHDTILTRKIGVAVPRPVRDLRIEERVDRMLAGGLVEEVTSLLAKGLGPGAPAFRAIGHADVVAHVAGDLSRDELRSRMIAATRRYAKRQDTWFRKEPGVAWLTWDGGSLNDLFGRAMLALGPFTQVSR